MIGRNGERRSGISAQAARHDDDDDDDDDRTLSGAITLGQSGIGSNGNEGVLRIPLSSSITGTSPSDCLVSYPGLSLWVGSYPSAEAQPVYSTAPGDRAIHRIKCKGSFILSNSV